ncbi:MFS transporter [Clostridium sp. 'White wine YQ']|uniref:MFS transporter n=1 Tax=Clostridium sp. 'White wine YQ' TaxID=3027474 RepID=UPI002365AE84|nr:MFS transporter [Clostridium sp. 'White wine YQ']MDD7795404.1 MFS transporter [Clostridium sp. 'White wine YQ']
MKEFTNRKLVKISILSVSLLPIMAATAVAPILGSIGDTFVNTNPTLIKMILTIPAIMTIPVSLLSGRLASTLKKRHILIVGILFYWLGGFLPYFSNNIYTLLFYRAFLGVGVGLILPLSTSIIADFFDGDERKKMIGLSSAWNNIGGAIAVLLSGILGRLSWRYSFGTYLIAIFPLIMVVFILPEPKKIENKQKTIKSIMNKALITVFMKMLLFYMIFYVLPTNIALFLKSENLGSTNTAAFFIASTSFMSFVTGLYFGKIIIKLKNYSELSGWFAMFLGFVILSTSHSVIFLFIAVLVMGFAFAILFPLFLIDTTKCAPKYANAFALSIVGSFGLLGQFLSPIIVNVIGNIIGISSVRFSFQFSAIACIIVIVTLYFSNIRYSSISK